jgi:cation diffusion facilitator CzcD-associated flavoprotein CzcO
MARAATGCRHAGSATLAASRTSQELPVTLPGRNTLAIVGAGPIGLEAAVAAAARGFDVHVFERGEVGAHTLAWGHVRMFTPWRMNLGPVGAPLLRATGWSAPEPGDCPTGRELAERYLQPLARLSTLEGRLHTHVQIVHVGRRGLVKGDARRGDRPFRILARDQGGRENFLHAFAVIDASGVYGQPNWAGDGGIPARGELYLKPQMSYHVDDVLDARRERYAGKRTLVIGGGASAATVVSDLAWLAEQAPGTSAVWATRASAAAVLPDIAGDPLPERRALYARARALARGERPEITHVGDARVEGFEYNSATHRYRVTLVIGEQPRVEEADQVIVATGFGPDDSLYRELQVHECYASRAPMKLAAALLGATDCLDAPAVGADTLSNPEPNFYILGNKSYGRSSHFLLETGYRQVSDVVEKLARELEVPAST